MSSETSHVRFAPSKYVRRSVVDRLKADGISLSVED